MVARRSPPKLQFKKKTVAAAAAVVPPPPLDPILLRETINKVDKAIARLQELQFTVTGGEMVVSGVTLSPRSTRGYLRTSLKCKQETLRMKNSSARRSPTGKLPKKTGDWKRMSLPAMLLGETVGEIIQASQFARQLVEAADDDPKAKKSLDDPKTPLIQRKQNPGHSELLPARRKREKQVALQTIRSDSNPISLQRTKSRINFKASSPPLHGIDCEKENCRYIANRVSPRNKPWVKKTVLFPNPLFHSSLSPTSTSKNQTLCKNKSPAAMIHRSSSHQTPHKFLIKSPPKMRSPKFTISPTRSSILRKKKSPIKESAAAKLRRSFSPARLANKLASPLKSRKSVQENDGIKSTVIPRISSHQTPHTFLIKSPKTRSPKFTISPTRSSVLRKKKSPIKESAATKLRRSFSPSRLANKLASPLKSRKSVQESDGIKMMKMMMVTTGQKQKQRSSFSSPPKVSSSSAIRKSLSPTNSTILKESTAARLRRSFSPSRLATKLASPLKSRKSVSKIDGMKMMMMMKQRSSPPKISTSGIRRSFSTSKSKNSVSENDGLMKMKMMSGLKQRPINANAYLIK